MKKSAVLVVHHDTTAKKYETEMVYSDKVLPHLEHHIFYVSPSSKVPIELIKIAVGKRAIIELEKLERKYLDLNNKK